MNPKCVARLMRQRGLHAISPTPRLSQPAAGQTLYPDLWRGVAGDRGNQVWSAAITYSRLQSGLISLVAVSEWFSRDVLSWAVSITMDVSCCLEALEQALSRGRPEVFNTDQGAQFTSQESTARQQQGGVRIRMDGRGRALDHVFIERLWRSVKQQEVYLRDDQSVWDARHGLAQYVGFYHEEQLHQALGYRTPAMVYRG